MTQFRQCHCDVAPEYSVVIEDDGRVCYAYMMRGHKLVGDVWLYNSLEAPETPEWTLPDRRERMPFLNARGFAEGAAPFDLYSQASLEWTRTQAGVAARLLVNGALLAVVAEGVAPGWHRCATQAGPLARPLSEYEEGAR